MQIWVTHEDSQPARVGGRILTLPLGTMVRKAVVWRVKVLGLHMSGLINFHLANKGPVEGIPKEYHALVC